MSQSLLFGAEEFVANLIASGRCWDEDTRSLEEVLEAFKKRFTLPDKQAPDRILLGQILKCGVLACQPVKVKPFGNTGIEVSGRCSNHRNHTCILQSPKMVADSLCKHSLK